MAYNKTPNNEAPELIEKVVYPVSYTHLDVYKRQLLHGLSTKTRP